MHSDRKLQPTTSLSRSLLQQVGRVNDTLETLQEQQKTVSDTFQTLQEQVEILNQQATQLVVMLVSDASSRGSAAS